jgi:very-short-patch-repair endonuclease
LRKTSSHRELQTRTRRILFIPTTSEKFFSVKELNFLFNSSRLEDQFWNALLLKNIFAERQYFVTVSNKNFFLDFALFCKDRNIDIEIDGDRYHMEADAVRNDKQRSNLLATEGWSVLRFTTKEINYNLDASINIVMEAANKYGGLKDFKNPEIFNYLNKDDGQMKIFS